MPTNLPPEAQEAERQYKTADTVEDKISFLEEFLSLIPKHKGTDHLRADLRRKLSKLKSSAQSRKKTAKSLSPYHIDQEGAGQVVLIGATNTGKSALLRSLTNATPEVSEVPFSTWGPTPGMMLVGKVQIQLIDTPPLSDEYVDPEMPNLLRRADIILIVIDLQGHPIQQLEDSVAFLERNRMYGQHRAHLYEGEARIMIKPIQVAVNKCDDEECDEVYDIFCELLEEQWPLIPVSATSGRNLNSLGWAIFDELGIIRVYSKAPGQDPNTESPFVMEAGGTVEDFARKVHQDFYQNLKAARVWGSSTFDGQMVQRDYVLHDEDIVELRT
jgi:ribosome-interacting GTPase 1